MKRIFYLFMILLIAIPSAFARDLSGNSLFADHKSRKIGDLLTVLIVESAQASNEAKTSTANSNSLAMSGKGSGALDFIPEFGASGSGSNTYAGSGKTERKGSLKATLAVRISEILANGNYIISGSKRIEVNGEKQITALEGLIRPEDILDNNSIYSNNIANLEITYSGEGVVADVEDPGLLTRVINWLF